MPRPRLPLAVNAILIAIGMLAVGGRTAIAIAPTPPASTIVEPGSTWTQTSVRTVKRVVHGHVIHENHKVYVYVPVVIVHTDHRTIRVPAHKLPLRSASATVANPLVTVYVPVASTMYVPTTVTETTTETDLVSTTITVTLPLDPAP